MAPHIVVTSPLTVSVILPSRLLVMPNPTRSRTSGGLSAISIPQSPHSYTSSLSSPNSGHSLSPSLSPLVPAPSSFKRQRSAEPRWDTQSASTDDDREWPERDEGRRRRRSKKKSDKVLLSPLTVGMGQVSVKDGQITPTAAGMPHFSLSASSAFLPLAPSLSPSSSAIAITRSVSHIPGVVLSGHATIRAHSPSFSPSSASSTPSAAASPLLTTLPPTTAIPPLHPVAFHPLTSPANFPLNTVFLASPALRYPAPISVPVVPLAPPSSSTMLFMSPVAASSTLSPFFSSMQHMPPGAVPLSHSTAAFAQQPQLSPSASQSALPTFASSSVRAILPQSVGSSLTSSSTLTAPFPWLTEQRNAGSECRRYLLNFPDDSSHGAQNGLYQPGKPSELMVRMKRNKANSSNKSSKDSCGKREEAKQQMRGDDQPEDKEQRDSSHKEVDGECEVCEVKLPVKIALKPTVKESATVRRFDELALHPAAFYTQSADLAWEERNFATSAEHSEPPFLLLRQDWKNPIALVHIARYGRQQREVDDLSPLHLLPIFEGSLAHTQTRGRGKTLQQRLETAQLYLSMCVGKWYELRAHSGWRVDGVEMRHFKGGRQVQRVEIAVREMELGATSEDVVAVVGAMSGSAAAEACEMDEDAGGSRRQRAGAKRGQPLGCVKVEQVKDEPVIDLSPSASTSLQSDVEAVQLLGALSQPQLVTAS